MGIQPVHSTGFALASSVLVRPCSHCGQPLDLSLITRPTGSDQPQQELQCHFCGQVQAPECAAEAPLPVTQQNYRNWVSAADPPAVGEPRCWCCLRGFEKGESPGQIYGILGLRLQCARCSDPTICVLCWLKDAKTVKLSLQFNEKRQAEIPTCPDCGWYA